MSEKLARVSVDLPESQHKTLRIETIKRGTTISIIVRAFLFAWLKRDSRAEAIVKEFGDS